MALVHEHHGGTVSKPKIVEPEYKTIDDLTAIIKKLDKKYKMTKVNIIHSGSGTNGEGIWAVPADDVSKSRSDDPKSQGEEIFVRLCNRPLWPGYYWGSLVRATTNCNIRPSVSLTQTDPRVVADRELITPLMEAAIKKAMAEDEPKQEKPKKAKTNKLSPAMRTMLEHAEKAKN